MKAVTFALAAPAILGLSLALSSCAKDLNAVEVNQCATKDVFEQNVSPYLELRCGTLDCHGSTNRNMMLFGYQGVRLPLADPNATPNLPGSADTTIDEYVANYHSIVGLEPEIMTAVVQDGGAHPERLTMIRKARGTESHKGNQIWNEGDDSDTCVTSWLAGNIDKGACARAVMAVETRPCNP